MSQTFFLQLTQFFFYHILFLQQVAQPQSNLQELFNIQTPITKGGLFYE